MSFTNDEIALIEGVISTIYPRLTGEKLRKSFAILHRHLQEGGVNQIDLQRIDSALTFADPHDKRMNVCPCSFVFFSIFFENNEP